MLWFFSIKGAIIILFLGLVFGWILQLPKRLNFFVDLVTLGAGRMLAKDYVAGVTMPIFTLLMVFLSRYLLGLYQYNAIFQGLAYGVLFLFTLQMAWLTPDKGERKLRAR